MNYREADAAILAKLLCRDCHNMRDKCSCSVREGFVWICKYDNYGDEWLEGVYTSLPAVLDDLSKRELDVNDYDIRKERLRS